MKIYSKRHPLTLTWDPIEVPDVDTFLRSQVRTQLEDVSSPILEGIRVYYAETGQLDPVEVKKYLDECMKTYKSLTSK